MWWWKQDWSDAMWRLTWLVLPLKVEMGYNLRNGEQPLETEKGKETFSCLEPLERDQPFWYLDFSPQKPDQTSDFQNCKIINVCCFEPLSLWWIVRAAIENWCILWHMRAKLGNLFGVYWKIPWKYFNVAQVIILLQRITMSWKYVSCSFQGEWRKWMCPHFSSILEIF